MRPRTALALAAAAGAVLADYALLIEPGRLVVRPRTLDLPGWPPELDGLRAGVMSDLHGGALHAGRGAIEKWVARLNEERPDVILLLGDFVDAHFLFGRRLAPERVAERLAALRAPYGVHAVLGNHDWKAYGARVPLALQRAGITVLEDSSVAVDTPRGRFHVAGLGDLRARRPDVVRALAAVPPGEPVLLLSHDPDLFPAVPDRVSLTLSGHTHAGQIAIPYLRRPFLPSYYGERYARGVIVEDGRTLFVSSGLGTSGAPVRFLAAPELPVLTLRSRGRPRA